MKLKQLSKLMFKLKIIIHKLSNWEYWRVELIYVIPFFYFLYLAFKARSFGFFNACNPSIKNGGFAMESKTDIYKFMPERYYPKSLFFKSNNEFEFVKNEISAAGLSCPLIIKPDIGLRGLKVEKIESFDELEIYLQNCNFDFIIQEFIEFPFEVGVFYCRLPNESNGKITGIVYKEFLKIIGDGKRTLDELIKLNPRFLIYYFDLSIKYSHRMMDVLKFGEELLLVPIGNHARGTKFLDVSYWNNKKLSKTINDICIQIPDFYYGRLDIKYKTRSDLERGINISIIELNGAASEPAHMYDPKYSLLNAWKEIIKHHRLLFEISIQNRKKGKQYLKLSELVKLFRSYFNYIKILKNA